MNEYYLILAIGIVFVLLFYFLNKRINYILGQSDEAHKRIDILPEWKLKDSREMNLYNDLRRAHQTIDKLTRKVKKLKVVADIRKMNKALERKLKL